MISAREDPKIFLYWVIFGLDLENWEGFEHVEVSKNCFRQRVSICKGLETNTYVSY